MQNIKSTEILMRAIEHYGVEHQVTQAIEELAEVIVELSKYKNNQGLRIHILRELADALIMLEQMAFIFGREEVHGLMNQKLEKLSAQMKDESQISGAI